MPLEPDIVVQGPGVAPLLVVEVKAGQLPPDASALKHYMSSMNVPIGMLISPTKLALYRETFVGSGEDSIQRVGEYSLADLLPVDTSTSQAEGSPTARAFAFEAAVQQWLESLTRGESQQLPAPLRDALEEHVMPALREGQLRSAGPRWRRTGS